MCGIFGLIANRESNISNAKSAEIIKKLFILSESRGKESAGIAIKTVFDKKIQILKQSVAASELIRSFEYQNYYCNSVKNSFDEKNKLHAPIAIIAHARLVTNGSQENNNNNQPIIKSNSVAVHNGIITNVDELWNKYSYLGRELEVDTEVLIAIIKNKIEQGNSIIDSLQSAFQEIKGTASTAILFSEYNKVVIASNNASLYFALNKKKGILIFASENYILQTAIDDLNLKEEFNLSDSIWSEPFSGMLIDISSFEIDNYKLNEINNNHHVEKSDVFDVIINHSPDKPIDFEAAKKQLKSKKQSPLRNLLKFNIDKINKLTRCSKCLLPETFPFINYDENGVCNYCNSYTPHTITFHKEEKLKKILKKYIRSNTGVDCIVPFSGGRDSSYGLHYIVTELKLKPLTFTYDWGMVTDLARRNIARVCGKLGVENIIVSADIKSKRKNIKLNVEAWLKKPELGMIPLFMAGDKHFFYYVNVIKRQTKTLLDIWMTNPLEDTNFKVGFAGQKPDFDKKMIDSLSFRKKVGLALYYTKNFLSNPFYINRSIFDTAWAFYSYYAEPRENFYLLYDYLPWDEKKIETTLINEYDWEIDPESPSTWRIGDGTASFYNYIYFTVAGFSEFDTFRSNQIREGQITREDALKLVNNENRPRYQAIKWYCDTIGIDFERTITIINSIKPLY